MSTNLTFLLVGKTGVGKSAAGNSILGRNVFVSTDSPESETQEIQIKSGSRLGYHVTVVDSPGVMHTDLNLNESKLKICRDLQSAVYQCPDDDGLMAIVLVLKYGDRYTEENRTVISILKQMFGQENLLKSCVIVLTYGDFFSMNNEGTITFENWLTQQRGELGELFQKVKWRCLLFNNKARTLQDKNDQILRLIELVSNLDQGYTKAKFSEVKKQHARLIIETQLPHLRRHYLQIHSDFKSRFQVSFSFNYMNELKILIKEVKKCLREMDEKDDPSVISYQINENRLLERERRLMETLMENIKRQKKILIMDATIENFLNFLSACDEPTIQQTDMHEKTYLHFLNAVESDYDFLNLRNKLCMANTILTCIKRICVIKEYESKLDAIRQEVERVKIPTLVSTFTRFFNKLTEMAKELADHSQEYGEMDKVLIELSDLRSLVECLKEDNDINIGWTSTSVILAGISVGTAFIPVIGWGVTAALNVAPVVGKLVHNNVVRSKRSKENIHGFSQCKVGDKVKIFCPLEIVKKTQETYRLWRNDMNKYLKDVGTVKRITPPKNVLVQFDDGMMFHFHQSLLYRVS